MACQSGYNEKTQEKKIYRSNIASNLIPFLSFLFLFVSLSTSGDVLRSDTSCNCKQMQTSGCTSRNFSSHSTHVQPFISVPPRWSGSDREELPWDLGTLSMLCNGFCLFVLQLPVCLGSLSLGWGKKTQNPGFWVWRFESGMVSSQRGSTHRFQPGVS